MACSAPTGRVWCVQLGADLAYVQHTANERPAWEVGALLLVSIRAFVEGQTVQGRAAVGEVLSWLVRLSPR